MVRFGIERIGSFRTSIHKFKLEIIYAHQIAVRSSFAPQRLIEANACHETLEVPERSFMIEVESFQ